MIHIITRCSYPKSLQEACSHILQTITHIGALPQTSVLEALHKSSTNSNLLLDSLLSPCMRDTLTKALARLAPQVAHISRDIELLLLSEKRMRALNLQALGKDYATDVLSFPLLPLSSMIPNAKYTLDSLPLGSIAINISLARTMSHALHHSIEQELCILFLHGTLHLLGFNHEHDTGEQHLLESLFAHILSLPKTLTTRQNSPS